MTAGNTLIDSGGITLSNAQLEINGAGTISVGGAISGTGTIAAGVAGTSGGTLDLTGAGSISSGVVLAINYFSRQPRCSLILPAGSPPLLRSL